VGVGTKITGRLLTRYQALKAEKAPWLALYDMISKYVLMRDKHILEGVTPVPVNFSRADLFDLSAADALHLMAASLTGALWPNGGRTFRILPPLDMQKKLEEDDEVKNYYQFVTQTLASYMDEPKAGLHTSLDEYMSDQGSFGVSGISVFEDDDPDTPFIFRAEDVKGMVYDESAKGVVDSVFIERRMTVRQAAQEYGYDALSQTHKDCYTNGDVNKQAKILIVIEPRRDRDPFSYGAKGLPVAGIHFDLDTPEVILRETGYHEMPVLVTRFWKLVGEKQGRSPAMNALPEILELNQLREAYIVAVEKKLDPPMFTYSDSMLGSGVIDTSAGAITVFSASGRAAPSGDPIKPIYTIDDISFTQQRMAELGQIIASRFFIDRLLDLNNEQRMTLGEANIRNKLRGESLNPVYSRQITELFKPLIERCFMIAYRKGLLGVVRGGERDIAMQLQGLTPLYIPDAVAARMDRGQDVYRIEFISPAARIMQIEELNGLTQTLEVTTAAAALNPESMDVIDLDVVLRRCAELTGAPDEVTRAVNRIEEIRKARAEQAQLAQQLEASRQESEATRNFAQAEAMADGAGA
jgi:Bacteriophage head to tail connecting protein